MFFDPFNQIPDHPVIQEMERWGYPEDEYEALEEWEEEYYPPEDD